MAINHNFDADLASIIEDLGSTFTWSGSSYACICSPISKTISTDIAGYTAELDLQIVVRASLFTGTRPTAGQTLTVSGTTYRIERVETDEVDAGLNIFCAEEKS